MTVLKRPISFIAAAKSCRRPFVGAMIRGTGAIPVERPQDIAFRGEGKIVSVKDKVVKGENTTFTRLTKGGLLELPNKTEVVIADIVSDTEFKTTSLVEDYEGEGNYRIVPKI